MPVADYRLVFDVGTQSFPWGFVSVGLGFACLFGAGIFAIQHSTSRNTRKLVAVRWLWTVGCVFGVLWSAFAFAALRADFKRTREALRTQTAPVIDDVVTTVEPSGKQEKVVVGGKSFLLSENTVAPGYHVPSKEGGELRVGRRVRIHHLNGKILRLEIAP